MSQSNENNVEKNDNAVGDVNPSQFVPKEVLNNGKFACVQGEVLGKPSLLLLEHREFDTAHLLSDGYSGTDTQYDKIFHNDIYSKYILYPKQPANGTKATIIAPCTQKHVDKYRQQQHYLIRETADNYKNITLKHILKDQFDLQWVYNIFSGEKEVERTVYKGDGSDDDFMLMMDLHWDGIDSNCLHLLALPYKRNILSIRDLNSEHLPLLHNIKNKTIEVVKEKYNIEERQLRMYFHYQPTFYHLHVHVTNLKYEAPGTFVGKAHLLETVINNIELMSDYYQRATIPFTIRETDSLYTKYKDLNPPEVDISD